MKKLSVVIISILIIGSAVGGWVYYHNSRRALPATEIADDPSGDDFHSVVNTFSGDEELPEDTEPQNSSEYIPDFLAVTFDDPELSESSIRESIETLFPYVFENWEEKDSPQPNYTLFDLSCVMGYIKSGIPLGNGEEENESKEIVLSRVYNLLSEYPEYLLPVFISYKQVIYDFFNIEEFEASDASTLLMYLRVAYHDLFGNGNDGRVDSIYEVMTTIEYEHTMHYYDDILPLIDQGNLADFSRNYHTEVYKSGVVWAYSFWARRHNQGTVDIFKEILDDACIYYSTAYLYGEE